MHRFFLERNGKFAKTDDRFAMLHELVQMEGIFDRARVAINAMRIAVSEQIGIDPGENA
jgi:hypothetical protein